MDKLYLGIDIGSTTFKAVLLNERGKVRQTFYQRTRPSDTGRVRCSGVCSKCGACNFGQLRQTVDKFLQDAGVPDLKYITCTVVTGSQIVEDTADFIPYDFKISEVTAHVAGARHYHPDCKAILDVGGQDSKAMVFNEHMNMWNYKMSGICAAGTGAFLDSVAAKLDVPIEEMADRVNYDSNLEFSSVCAVLSATSINKFKNRFPLGDIIGGACRAQARTIMSGVGELFLGYRGDIVFQGGVAYNRAVAYYLREITGNNIVIPEFHSVMGALGAACLAREFSHLKGKLEPRKLQIPEVRHESVALRAAANKKTLFDRSGAPVVWRNLFFPPEVLNALGVNSLTLETYAALFARNQRRIKRCFDKAACKGFSGETCSFLRVLEGSKLPVPAAVISTSQPCQQGERIFRDLARDYNVDDRLFSLHTPANGGLSPSNIEHLADELERSVAMLEKATGCTMTKENLKTSCELSNAAREYSLKVNELRHASPPLIRGTKAIYFASIFSQLWGRPEMVEIQKALYAELLEAKEKLDPAVKLEDTHRLMWLHLPPFYDTALLDYLEVKCNAPILFEEVNFVGWKPLDPADPYRSLARKILTQGFMDPELRVKEIIEVGKKMHFNGCILYNHGFGRCSMSDSSFIKHLRQELTRAAVPLLVLDGDCVDTTIDPCSTETKISAYVEALNLKKYGNIFGRLKGE
ncbi:MAG: 2-hydroxyacyl-CoA dehydratase [Lentisphaeria bacterium]|nr:2-hydroxyacyl-CoA dehydratase [Lentisphaeria bacterium]